MSRIRTVKPELLKHEELFDLERETGLPIRIAWVGLFTVCDRDGRFAWRPRAMKTDVLPYDDLDFSRVLHALMTRGLIEKYRVGRDWYGWIPTFAKHQAINNKERPSDIPSIDDADEIEQVNQHHDDAMPTREPRVKDAIPEALGKEQGEGKGREGKGKEGEGEYGTLTRSVAGQELATTGSREVRTTPAERKTAKTAAIWDVYASAYLRRYSTEPVRNAKVNALLAQVVDRLGSHEAPHVAAWYVGSNRALYVSSKHCAELLSRDCEGLRTEWATQTRMTDTEARHADQHQAAYEAAEWGGRQHRITAHGSWRQGKWALASKFRQPPNCAGSR